MRLPFTQTTLLNYILTANHGKKICVIENEFGETSIDDQFVYDKVKTKEHIKVMDNGCVCCTVRGDLVDTFIELIDLDDQYDAVIIETTGLADPVPIMHTVLTQPDIETLFKIDGVLTMVDCKHVGQHLIAERKDDEVNEAVQQVAFADKIMLNKLDLVTAGELKALKDNIRQINQFAEIITCPVDKTKIPMDKLLELNAFSLDRALDLDKTLLESDDEEEEEEVIGHGHGQSSGHGHGSKSSDDGKPAHGHGHGGKDDCKDDKCDEKDDGKVEHGHGHDGKKRKRDDGDGVSESRAKLDAAKKARMEQNAETAVMKAKKKSKSLLEKMAEKPKKKKHNLGNIGSVGVHLDGRFDFDKFTKFMQGLVEERKEDIWRSKGVCMFHDKPEKWAFQGVHEQVVFKPTEMIIPDGAKESSTVVLIGKNLDREEFKKALEDCIYVAEKVEAEKVEAEKVE